MSELTEESKTNANSATLLSTLGCPKSFSRQRNVFNEASDNEFDDTESELETPRLLRRDLTNYDTSRQRIPTKDDSSTTGNPHIKEADTSRQNNHRTVTTTIPLKDEDNGRKPTPTTPSKQLLERFNKYRSRNGTPLKQSPIRSSPKFSRSDNEAELIRNLKLISDDNKFLPDSPLRNRSITSNPMSPPSNLKIKPLNFGSVVEQQKSELLDQIVSTSIGKSIFNPDNPLRSTSDSIVTHVKPNPHDIDNDSIDEDEIDIERLTETVRSEALTKEEIMEQINSSVNYFKEKDISRNKPEAIPQFNEKGYGSNDEDDGEDDDDEVEPEILQELDSYLPKSEIQVSNRRVDEESDDNPKQTEYPSPELMDPSPEPMSIASPVKIVPESEPKSNSLSGQYARHLMKKRREKHEASLEAAIVTDQANASRSAPSAFAEKHSAPPSFTQKSSAPSPFIEKDSNSLLGDARAYPDWSTQKWNKLQKLLNLPTLTQGIIINSELVRKSLGCESKDELKDRVQYLVEYQRAFKRAKSKTYRVSKKRRR